MELDTDRLSAILDLLRDAAVEEFECDAFHVRFASGHVPEATKAEVRTIVSETRHVEPTNETQWHHPALWNGATPPSFPKKAK